MISPEEVEGETIEKKIERIINNNDPIDEGAPIMYQERKEGVPWETNVKTDRFELAVEGTNNIVKMNLAKREEVAKAREKPDGDDSATPEKS